MTGKTQITLFHAPNSRSTATLMLLEELGVPYDLKILNLKAGEQRQPAYLAVNPMGKVPAILHGDALVTEQIAIMLYLGDLFPDSGLAPGMGDPRRGAYLRWMVFYAACFEPAMTDKAMKREAVSAMMSPYGDVDTVLAAVTAQLRAAPYMLGAEFSICDVVWGTALGWMVAFGILAETPEIKAYVERVSSRPAAVRVREKDAALAAAQ